VSALERLSTGDVLLVRHAQTAWSRDGRHTGRTDIPLTEEGRNAARALGHRLGRLHPAAILISPSARARETFELCGMSGEAQVREDLLEWDYGDYEGLTSAQIKVERPRWDLWRDGCPGGEMPAEVGARADRLVAELNGIDGIVAVFSHGHVLRVLGARWIGLEPEGGGRLGLSTGALCTLGHEHGRPILSSWNDTGM
jgi:broad specificity phosphatase PhoE